MGLTDEEMKAIYKSLFLKEMVLRVLVDDVQNRMAEIKVLRKKFEQELVSDTRRSNHGRKKLRYR